MEIIAHRGASAEAPENTLAAVRLAWAQRADAVEVDVHLTRDGQLAVIHDADTTRTAGVTHLVADTPFAALERLDVGTWKAASFRGERIPRLGDVLALVPPAKRIFVELKSGLEAVDVLAREVEAAVRAQSLRREQVAVISFDEQTAASVKRVLPAHEVCWIVDAGEEAPEPTLAAVFSRAQAAGLDGVDLSVSWPLGAEDVSRAHALGLKVYVWTVDALDVARRLAAAGVDGLTTNRPGWLREQLRGG